MYGGHAGVEECDRGSGIAGEWGGLLDIGQNAARGAPASPGEELGCVETEVGEDGGAPAAKAVSGEVACEGVQEGEELLCAE